MHSGKKYPPLFITALEEVIKLKFSQRNGVRNYFLRILYSYIICQNSAALNKQRNFQLKNLPTSVMSLTMKNNCKTSASVMPTGFLDSNFYIQNALIQLLACKYPTHVQDEVITLTLVKV